MKGKRLVLVLAALAVLSIVAAALIWPRGAGERSAVEQPTPSYRPPGPADRPYTTMTKDRQLDRVMHKDSSGLSPLEYVETPQGRITIERTFSEAGRLLAERAFLDGKPVPVPPRPEPKTDRP